MKLSTLGNTLSSTEHSETADFKREFAHPELGDALKGVRESGTLVAPVSGPNPKLKTEPGPTVSGPTGSREPNFQYQSSYMGSGNKEMQGEPVVDVPLNGFKREPAHVEST